MASGMSVDVCVRDGCQTFVQLGPGENLCGELEVS